MNWKKINMAILISVSSIVCAQNIEASPQGIKANFSEKSILAYQENSQHKIAEFYEYLTLYSNEKNPELRKQIQSNILSMVSSKEIEVLDFTDSATNLIDLSELLEKIKNQDYKFEIDEMESSENISLYEWENSYQLKISKGENFQIRSISQCIIFEPLEKKFGKKSKLVWEMKLDEMFED